MKSPWEVERSLREYRERELFEQLGWDPFVPVIREQFDETTRHLKAVEALAKSLRNKEGK